MLEIHKKSCFKREAISLISNHAHAHARSPHQRQTQAHGTRSDVVEHGCGDQLPEGTAARLAAGDGIGDLLANEAVKDDFSQTLVVVVGAGAIAVVMSSASLEMLHTNLHVYLYDISARACQC